MTEYLLKSDVMALLVQWYGEANGVWIKSKIGELPTHTFPDPSLAGWQDISSAPKDGSYILTSSLNTMLPSVICWQRHGDSGWWEAVSGAKGFKPTHWMPLPPAPSVAAPASGNSKLDELFENSRIIETSNHGIAKYLQDVVVPILRLLAERGDK